MNAQSIVLSDVNVNDTVGMLKEEVNLRVGIKTENIWLCYKGVKLQDDDQTLADLNIKHGDSISYNLRSLGGTY